MDGMKRPKRGRPKSYAYLDGIASIPEDVAKAIASDGGQTLTPEQDATVQAAIEAATFQIHAIRGERYRGHYSRQDADLREFTTDPKYGRRLVRVA